MRDNRPAPKELSEPGRPTHWSPVYQFDEQKDQAAPPVVAPIKGGAVVGMLALVMVGAVAWIATNSTREQVNYQRARAEAAEQQALTAEQEAQKAREELTKIRRCLIQ